MEDGFACTGDHGRIHYLEAGQGRPVLLLHSNGNSAYEYEDLMREMAPTHRLIAMDFPGHGDSEPLRRHYGVADYADAAIALLDALGIERASILGSSIGGAVCVDIGVRHAQRVENLFVVESPVRTPEQWKERWLATEKGYGTVMQTADQVRPRLRQLTDELLERWNIDRSKAGTWAMMDVMWALREYDVLAAIPHISARTAVIYGIRSPHPHGLSIFAEKLPQAQRFQMENCGHFPMLDDPVELARIMTSVIDS